MTWKTHAPYESDRTLSATIQNERGDFIANVRLWGNPSDELHRRLDLIAAAPDLLDMLRRIVEEASEVGGATVIDKAQELYDRLKEKN